MVFATRDSKPVEKVLCDAWRQLGAEVKIGKAPREGEGSREREEREEKRERERERNSGHT